MEISYMMIGADGRQYGPITLEQLKTWACEGRVTRETNILRSDTNAWLPAVQYVELGFGQPAVAAAPVAPGVLTSAAPAAAAPLRSLPQERVLRRGANWFYWIAALSLINTVLNMSGQRIVFVIGLGVTQFVDGIASEMNSGGTAIGLVLNIIIAGIFALFGFFASKRHSSAFIVGMVLYVLDALLFVVTQMWLGLAFHIYVLFWLFLGVKANLQLNAMERGAGR